MKSKKLNEGTLDDLGNLGSNILGYTFKSGGAIPFDILNRMGGAVRGFRRAYNRKTATDLDAAKAELLDEMMNAFLTYSKSLRRMGYNSAQINSFTNLFKQNMKEFIDFVINEAIDSLSRRPPAP